MTAPAILQQNSFERDPGPIKHREAAEGRALAALQQLLQTGRLPEDLPEGVAADPAFVRVTTHLVALQQFALALAGGDLQPELSQEGRLAEALKSLQSNLRHVTWQTQRISEGDLGQQVHFIGDFAAAFNSMVENLHSTRQALEVRARELADGRRAALNLMLDAQSARQEAETAYAKLQVQMEETRALQVRLQEQAIRDPMTGCFNRRYLEETLPREFHHALREGYPLSIAMGDVDRFKTVNDMYGHPAGDAMLQALASLLRSHTRAGDIVCRHGGDEFLVVLPGLKPEDAYRRADQWRAEFEGREIAYGGAALKATLSIGLASFPSNGETAEQVIKGADQALYRAKRAGRNCVELA